MTARANWGATFDPDELGRLETRMWKAYYRKQPARLFGLLVRAVRAQAGVSWPRALAGSVLLTKAAAGFSRATGDYERFAPDIVRGYRLLGLPEHVDIEAVARHELRWWVVRREIGLAAGAAAGESITDLYAAIYDLPRERVAEAGRLVAWRPRCAIAAPPPTPTDRPARDRVLARGRAIATDVVPEPSRAIDTGALEAEPRRRISRAPATERPRTRGRRRPRTDTG
jgi:hypothetical protein